MRAARHKATDQPQLHLRSSLSASEAIRIRPVQALIRTRMSVLLETSLGDLVVSTESLPSLNDVTADP